MSNRFKNKDKFNNNIDDILNAGKELNNEIKKDTKEYDKFETNFEYNNTSINTSKDIIFLEKQEKDEMVRVSFYIKKSQHELLKKYAKKTNRNKNEFVRYMIDKFFAAVKK
ncbi:hypothetical protein [Tepidibacter formicigenes]|jgi:hypothetical protein|uniref:Ribbon-helix-helix protein, copG family n=1 Tax=Tepidibacter formicigenes DSM 15518 TaxID=1123349 RepID=A0A1M6U3Q3_9FIRM|nr:hypothetical protein [Tepidibacter formicigenes]SHK63817.1 hypothetical protein SAMN02744037_02728 [Tepidibacter formicigenes DSM 15518]